MKYASRAIVAVLIFGLMLFWIISNVRLVGPESFYAVHVDKLARLQSLSSPKIVLVGGSNLAFGMDTKRMERELGLPVANMGLDAGFGVEAMLNAVKAHLKKGDIVVLCIEQRLYQDDIDPNEEFFHLMAVSPEAVRYLDHPRAWSALANRFKPYIKMKLTLLSSMVKNNPHFWQALGPLPSVRPRKNYFDKDSVTAPEFSTQKVVQRAIGPFVQLRQNYNDEGDMIAHRSLGPFAGVTDGGICKAGGLYDRDTINYVNDFVRFCQKRNVTVVRSCAPNPQELYDRSPQLLDDLEKDVSKYVVAQSISDYHNYIYPTDHFFDRPPHLNGRGTDRRVTQLISDLKGSGCLNGQSTQRSLAKSGGPM